MTAKAGLARLLSWARSLGTPPSDSDVLRQAKKFGVRRTDRQLVELARRTYNGAARFKELRRPRPGNYQRVYRVPFRTVFLDLAFMNKTLRRHNGGNVGFLLAVCAHTNLLGAVPFAKRDVDGLYEAIALLLDTSPLSDVVEILTDGESALRSAEVRRRLRRDRGIRFVVLGSRSKAYKAERYIRYVRTNLSKLMAGDGSKNWTARLAGVLARHNKARVEGTRFRRVDVDRSSFPDFMEEAYGISDWHALPGLARVTDAGIPGVERAFLFRKGQRVIADRKLVGEGGPYPKPSAEGYFSGRAYRVHRRSLATTKDLGLVPSEERTKSSSPPASFNISLAFFSVYRLRPDETGAPLTGWFYESELTAIGEEE